MEIFTLVTDIILIIAGLYIALMVFDAIYDGIYALRKRINNKKALKQTA